MANKTANIDFGKSVNRMNRMTSEQPRKEPTEESMEGHLSAGQTCEANNPLREQQELSRPTLPASAEQPSQTGNDERRGPGRKKRENNVRTNPKTIFFDNATDYAMSMIKLNNGIDKKDLVLAATREFLEKYYRKEHGRLSNEGIHAIFQQLGTHDKQ